jgi:hypothetical protein
MSTHYLPALRFLFFAALYLSPGRAVLSQDSPGPASWTRMETGQTVSGVRYAKDGKILSGTSVATTCKSDRFQVLLSAPSPQRGLVMLICDNDTGDLEKAYIVDPRHSRASTLNLGSWRIGTWVSWSPNESHALIDIGAEDGPPNMFLVDLRTVLKKAIRFKRFDREPENQGFDSNSVSWVSDNSFRVRLYTYCDDNYTGKVPCDDRAQRSYLARVNLAPFAISYSNIPQVPATRLK